MPNRFGHGALDTQRLHPVSKGAGLHAEAIGGIPAPFDLPAAILKNADNMVSADALAVA